MLKVVHGVASSVPRKTKIFNEVNLKMTFGIFSKWVMINIKFFKLLQTGKIIGKICQLIS